MQRSRKKRTIVKSVARPEFGSHKKQFVVIIRDDSSSMTGQKWSDAKEATKALIDTLADPKNKDGFTIAVTNFGSDSVVVQDFQKASEYSGWVDNIFRGSGTNIASGLTLSTRVLDEMIRLCDVNFVTPVVIIFSDGMDGNRNETFGEAIKLKEKATLVTVAFGDDADTHTLLTIATSEEHFFKCSNGDNLRHLFADFGDTLSKSIATGRDCSAMNISQMQKSQYK